MTAPTARPEHPPAPPRDPATSGAVVAAARSPRVAPWVWPVLAALVTLGVGLAILDGFPVGVFYDDGMYVVLAKSLATGHGLRWLNVPGAPVATHFPPGYPAVLALLWMLFPRFPANVVVFKIANACFLAAAAAGCMVFARRRFAFPAWAAAVAAIAASIGIPTLVLSTQVMSEPLFLALLFPILLFAESVADGPGRVERVFMLGLAIGALALVRTHAVGIIGGVGLVLLMRRRPRDAALAVLGVVIVLLPFQLWVRAHADAIPAAMGGSYQPYTTWFVDGLREMGPELIRGAAVRTVHTITTMFGIFAAPSMPRGVKLVALVLLAGLGGAGARRVWRTAPVTLLFMAAYLAVVVVWPFEPARFVWGIWPLLFLLPILGALEIAAWRPRGDAQWLRTLTRAGRLTAVAGAWLIAAGYVRYTVRAYRLGWWTSGARAQGQAARPFIRWVLAHAPADAVIASNVEPMIYLYTNRLAVPVTRFSARDYLRSPTATERAADIRGILAAYRVDVAGVMGGIESVRDGLRLVARQSPALLVEVDTLPDGIVYGRAGESTAGAEGGVSLAPSVHGTTPIPSSR